MFRHYCVIEVLAACWSKNPEPFQFEAETAPSRITSECENRQRLHKTGLKTGLLLIFSPTTIWERWTVSLKPSASFPHLFRGIYGCRWGKPDCTQACSFAANKLCVSLQLLAQLQNRLTEGIMSALRTASYALLLTQRPVSAPGEHTNTSPHCQVRGRLLCACCW